MQIIDALPFSAFLFISIFLMLKILFLKSKGIKVSSNPEKIKKNTLLLYPFFGFIFLFWLFEIIKPAFHISFSILPEMLANPLFEQCWLKISGTVLTLLSLILWTIALLHFKTSLRFGLDENNQGRLVTSGIFSFSRNPFFLALNLYFIGTALIFPSLFFIGFAILAVVSIHFFILKEEKFLRNIYGKEYVNYAEKVRRYL